MRAAAAHVGRGDGTCQNPQERVLTTRGVGHRVPRPFFVSPRPYRM